jgi:hypothetical protein
MSRELAEAVRELRLDPSQPVFVLVGPLLVELRAPLVCGGHRATAVGLEAKAREIQALQRVAGLIAAARSVGAESGRRPA